MVLILMKGVDLLIRLKFNLLSKSIKPKSGISFDGDADRIIMCDEKGKIIDGDQIIAMLSSKMEVKKNFKGWSNWNFNV